MPASVGLRRPRAGRPRAARRSAPASARRSALRLRRAARPPPGAGRGRTPRCPRRASWPRPGRGPSRLVRVGRGGQVAAVDRRAAGGVRDQRAVAEELGQQLDVGRLAAARAGARVLEQRLQELRALDVEALGLACGRARAGRGRTRSSRAPASRSGRCGAMSMALCRGLVLSLAGQTSTQSVQPVQSSGATWSVYLQALAGRRSVKSSDLKVAGAPARRVGLVDLGADGRVRADEHALVALDADRRVPDRDLGGEVALLPLRGAHRPGAVHGERAHRQQVALARHHHRASRAARSRARPSGTTAGGRGRRSAAAGTGDLVQVGEGGVHRREVPLHHLRARACRRSSRSPP